MRGNNDFRRRAAALQAAGLLPSAERVAHAWHARAQAAGDPAGMLEAGVRALAIALDRDQPDIALQVGLDALPHAAGAQGVDPELRARLHINLAKAAWNLGREDEQAAHLDAAARLLHEAPVGPVVRAHFAMTAGLSALEQGDTLGAIAWTLQARDLAISGGAAAVERGCLQNLIHAHILRGDTDRAAAIIERVLAGNQPDAAVVDVLEDAVRLALLRGDIEGASDWARRLTAGYCAAPSRLSPLTLGYMFETLGLLYASAGQALAAERLWETSAGWFAIRGRARDIARVREAQRRDWPAAAEVPAVVDETLLYLGDLLAAAHQRQAGQNSRHLASTVHRLLPEIAPEAEPVATEHAALLYGLPASARWFTGLTAQGQAAERVLAGHDEAAWSALEVLAAYERVASSGAPWPGVLRYMQRGGLGQRHVAALDRIYTSATA